MSACTVALQQTCLQCYFPHVSACARPSSGQSFIWNVQPAVIELQADKCWVINCCIILFLCYHSLFLSILSFVFYVLRRSFFSLRLLHYLYFLSSILPSLSFASYLSIHNSPAFSFSRRSFQQTFIFSLSHSPFFISSLCAPTQFLLLCILINPSLSTTALPNSRLITKREQNGSLDLTTKKWSLILTSNTNLITQRPPRRRPQFKTDNYKARNN